MCLLRIQLYAAAMKMKSERKQFAKAQNDLKYFANLY